MYVCVCVCLCMCMYVCVCVCVRVCTQLYQICSSPCEHLIVNRHMCMYVCMYICMYVYMYVSVYVGMYVCMHACMCVCVCVYAYRVTYAYTHKRTCIHTQGGTYTVQFTATNSDGVVRKSVQITVIPPTPEIVDSQNLTTLSVTTRVGCSVKIGMHVYMHACVYVCMCVCLCGVCMSKFDHFIRHDASGMLR
jgi:hypothetical protein